MEIWFPASLLVAKLHCLTQWDPTDEHAAAQEYVWHFRRLLHYFSDRGLHRRCSCWKQQSICSPGGEPIFPVALQFREHLRRNSGGSGTCSARHPPQQQSERSRSRLSPPFSLHRDCECRREEIRFPATDSAGDPRRSHGLEES